MTMGLLVGHFRELVEKRYNEPDDGQSAEPENFSSELMLMRDRFGHHMILLALLARADGDFAGSERRVIVEHCTELAGLDTKQQAIIDRYLREWKPALIQLDPALRRLEAEEPRNINMLIDSAERLIRVDGKVDPAELRLLEHMRKELLPHG